MATLKGVRGMGYFFGNIGMTCTMYVCIYSVFVCFFVQFISLSVYVYILYIYDIYIYIMYVCIDISKK